MLGFCVLFYLFIPSISVGLFILYELFFFYELKKTGYHFTWTGFTSWQAPGDPLTKAFVAAGSEPRARSAQW